MSGSHEGRSIHGHQSPEQGLKPERSGFFQEYETRLHCHFKTVTHLDEEKYFGDALPDMIETITHINEISQKIR